jgi:hypothetical protein
MTLQYDFDLGQVMPEGLPEAFGDLERTGVSAERAAMFRDPQTVAALKQADPAVQEFFIDSGFALQSYDSGAPAGRFPKRDEAARITIIEQLTKNLSQHALEGAHWGGFDFPAFMRALGAAKVLDDDALLAPSTSETRANPELAAAQQASRRLHRRRAIAKGGLLVGLLLLLFVASQMLL